MWKVGGPRVNRSACNLLERWIPSYFREPHIPRPSLLRNQFESVLPGSAPLLPTLFTFAASGLHGPPSCSGHSSASSSGQKDSLQSDPFAFPALPHADSLLRPCWLSCSALNELCPFLLSACLYRSCSFCPGAWGPVRQDKEDAAATFPSRFSRGWPVPFPLPTALSGLYLSTDESPLPLTHCECTKAPLRSRFLSQSRCTCCTFFQECSPQICSWSVCPLHPRLQPSPCFFLTAYITTQECTFCIYLMCLPLHSVVHFLDL